MCSFNLDYMMYDGVDIKPANLLINLRGDVKISDLGILREVDPAVDTNHLVHTYIGTTTYMSPERLDAKDYSYSSDIWSFGMSLLTLSFGKLPQQVSGRYWTMLTNIRENPPPSLSDDDDPSHSWSAEYQDFIAQCLRKDPRDRPTCQELLAHPFLQRASPESNDMARVQQVGARELQSILKSLCLHLESRQKSALDVFVMLRQANKSSDTTTSQHQHDDPLLHSEDRERGKNHTTTITLDVFNMSVLEMTHALLFNEYPSRVTQRVALLASEMSLQLERREGAALHVLHHFHDDVVMFAAEENFRQGDDCCNCYCCCTYLSEDEERPGASESCDKSTEKGYHGRRLAGLSTQLHLPLDIAEQTAREFLNSYFAS
jgi:serine/threonine protein kinase